MADFIHMDAAVNIDSTGADTMAIMKVVDSDDVPQSASLFTSQISSSNLDFTLNGLKLHLVQNPVKKAKVPLLSPLLCPCHTFLVSLILASKFTQDWCYSNKAWAKLSRLPPCEISSCECTLGDVLNWCLWVGKTPTGSPVALSLSNHAVVRSKCNRELFTSNLQNKNQSIARFSTNP